MPCELARQPSLVEAAVFEGGQEEISAAWQGADPIDPVVDRTLGAARDESEILVADVELGEARL